MKDRLVENDRCEAWIGAGSYRFYCQLVKGHGGFHIYSGDVGGGFMGKHRRYVVIWEDWWEEDSVGGGLDGKQG
jgi:hypothetical protein